MLEHQYTGGNRTLVNGMRLLAFMARTARPFSLVEISKEFGLPKSHVHRLLQTLVRLGIAPPDLTRITRNTIGTGKHWTQEMRKIRREDIAVNRCENNASAWSLAAPIRDRAGQLLAAIGLRLPAAQASRAEARCRRLVKDAAQQIEFALVQQFDELGTH